MFIVRLWKGWNCRCWGYCLLKLNKIFKHESLYRIHGQEKEKAKIKRKIKYEILPIDEENELIERNLNKIRYWLDIILVLIIITIGIFVFIKGYFPLYKSMMKEIFLFLGIRGYNNVLWGIFLLFVVVSITKIYLDNKFDFIKKKLNWFVVLSFIFVVFSLAISIVAAHSLIPKNFVTGLQIDVSSEGDDQDYNIGFITCESKEYIMATRLDDLHCDIDVENSYRELFAIEKIEILTNDEIKWEYDLLYYNQTIHTADIISLPDESSFSFSYMIYTNLSSPKGTSKRLRLEDPSIAASKKDQRTNIISTIILSTLSLSVFVVFSGMNSFREMWYNRKK